MSGSRVPAAIRNAVGDEATFGLIELFDREQKDWSDKVLATATDRFEVRLTRESELLRRDVQSSLHEGLTALRTELATTRIEMLRWSFVFWIGQVAAIAGLLALMQRALRP